jgi:hypothetical protein
MRKFQKGYLKTSVANYMKLRALQSQIFDGAQNTFHVMDECMTHYFDVDDTVHQLIYCRTKGFHSSGWWKNPDYEQCYDMSLSFRSIDGEKLSHDHKKAKEWLGLLFGENVRLLWVEPPYYEFGKTADTYHYRLFTDKFWQPIKPKGEVYSNTWTPKDWLSYSDFRAKVEAQ